jgi:hypothetical protein
MPAVQKIACVNASGYIMAFNVQAGNGFQSSSTMRYPIGEEQVIDLSTADPPLPDGTQMWPDVEIVLGSDVDGTPSVTYAENGQIAVYNCSGTSLDASCTLVRSDGETVSEEVRR